MPVESNASPLLTIDEVEKVQRQRIASFIGYVFQLTYAAMVDKLIQQEVVEQIDLNSMLNPTESICSALGFKLGKSWEAYVTELPKMPWTSIYLASLELDDFQQGDDLQSRILYALYYRPNGLKWKDFGDQ